MDGIRNEMEKCCIASSQELLDRACEVRQRHQSRDGKDNSLPLIIEGLALAAEATRRELGIEPYDVQLLAAWTMTQGAVAEMQTGEGKTLAVALAACALGMRGHGVHVSTSNAYLAERDAGSAAPLFKALGMRVGLIESQLPTEAKRESYQADVTYGPGYEFGFDYLRDQLNHLQGDYRGNVGDKVLRQLRGVASTPALQRALAFAIIDELDCVLIDEASLPLILSDRQPADAVEVVRLNQAAAIAASLLPEIDFQCEPIRASIKFTNIGLQKLAHDDCVPRDTAGMLRPWPDYVRQAIHAQHMLVRDVNYVVQDGRVLLVDQITGRVFPERRWQEGLHQAVEIKERVTVSAPSVTRAQVTRQRFYRRYGQLSGTTGTAVEAAGELAEMFGLGVETIPLRTPSRRDLWATRYFANAAGRDRAIVHETAQVVEAGRPVLIGCPTIDRSRKIAALLEDTRLPHQVLNGVQDANEAAVIAQAGRRGAITVATNLAGRGTDIRIDPTVAHCGGLHVIAVEHHASRRVDRQLLGRAGRQGEPGSGRVFVSADDKLLQDHPRIAEQWRRQLDDFGERSGDWSKQLLALQQQAEKFSRNQRREMLRHDQWLEELLSRLE